MDSPTEPKEGADKIVSGNINLQSQEIPFTYFPYICKAEALLKTILDEWKLDLPKIMLLIVSDNAPLKGWGSHKQQEKFVKGLIKCSNATSMWICTSGLNVGMPKIIGDAIQEDFDKRHSQICYRHARQKKQVTKAPLIGLCRRNLLTYQDKFENPESSIALENNGNIPDEQKFNLNPYHSHMFVIKSESDRKDSSSLFLLRLIDALRLSRTATTEADKIYFPTSPVPIIAILVQGNIYCIHYLLAHLKRKLPVLVIRGSGGLADVFSYAYYEVQRSFQKIKDKEYVETVLKRGLSDKITSSFPELKDNKMSQNLLCGRILECIENSEPPEMKHITVLNVLDLTCNMEDLPNYLLQVLFKSAESETKSLHAQLKKDLQLTIDWNCPEIALTKVFYKDTTFKVDNEVFERALLEPGREAFVSLFLDNGFTVHKYLSATRLVKLFDKALKQQFFREVCWERILGYGEVIELDDAFIDSDLNWIIENLIGFPVLISSQELSKNSVEIFDASYPKDIAVDVARRKAIMVLGLWALLSNRPQLVIVFWRQFDHPIMTALASALILDKMIMYINEAKIQEEIAELSKKFAKMAIGVYDLCYGDMPTKAYDALNVRIEEWAGHSLIDMASLSQNRTFVAHPCCQKYLTNKFMGNIKIRELDWGFMTFPVYIKVILCAFFIFPMYLWVRFKECSIHEFVGGDDYEGNDPYYVPQQNEDKQRGRREDAGRSHLLKYHYPPLWQMILWMWSAPITKFWVSNIFYMIYLTIFSVAVLWPSCGNIYLDSVVCAWTCLVAVDSAYLLFALRNAFPSTPLFGSCLEIIYMILFVIFFFLLRISGFSSFQDPYSGKILICGALLFFFYRMVYIYLPISSTMGPLLYRAKAMIMIDFVNFMKMILFILIGNGIAMQAILYPDYPLIPEIIRKSFHKTFFMFFLTPTGELSATDANCLTWEQKPGGLTMCRVSEYVDGKCSNGIGFWPYVLVFQYVLLLKLILNTVLFALFNNTGAKLGAESDSIWKFQRYKLIVNFSNCIRLPPPLNIFSVMITLYESILYCVKGGQSFFDKKKKDKKDDGSSKFLPSVEYTYWRKLASDYLESKDQEKMEESYIKSELDIISQLQEDINMKEILIYRTKAQITQLEAQICYTHAHLETLKYRAKAEEVSKVISLHSLSRESPYPRTNIQRFPVPDKYVPWEVMWLHYEPLIYTMPMEKFSEAIRPFVDDDIILLRDLKNELPSYTWNIENVDATGVYRNRKSWMVDKKNNPITYLLDIVDLPRNPMGRTGLRGKGALPRWGPNHNAYVIITRWKKTKSEQDDLIETSGHLEYVETWFTKKKDLSLPGGFVSSENKYEVIQSCFEMKKNTEAWTSSEDMIKFFQDHTSGLPNEEKSEDDFKSRQVYCGYMDDQMNTDQAWKEVDLWHIHYNIYSDLFKAFKANIHWRLLSEDVFIQLPYGQTTLLHDVIRPLKAQIAHQ